MRVGIPTEIKEDETASRLHRLASRRLSSMARRDHSRRRRCQQCDSGPGVPSSRNHDCGERGRGADVTIIDINPLRLAYVRDVVQGHVTTLMSNTANTEGRHARSTW